MGPVTAELRRLMSELRETHLLPTQIAPTRADTGAGKPRMARSLAFEQGTQHVTQQQTLLQGAAQIMHQGLGPTGAGTPLPLGAPQNQLQSPTEPTPGPHTFRHWVGPPGVESGGPPRLNSH